MNVILLVKPSLWKVKVKSYIYFESKLCIGNSQVLIEIKIEYHNWEWKSRGCLHEISFRAKRDIFSSVDDYLL